MSLLSDALEGGSHLRIQPVVAANAGDALIGGRAVVRRAAGYEHLRAGLRKRARNPAAHSKGSAGDHGDMAL